MNYQILKSGKVVLLCIEPLFHSFRNTYTVTSMHIMPKIRVLSSKTQVKEVGR